MRDEAYAHDSETGSSKKLNVLCSSSLFLIALAVRLYHLTEMPIDRLPDSYGHWLAAQLTVANGWFYTDFKPSPNNTVVWLPLFQYLIGIAMYLAANSSIVIPRLTSVLFGSLACLIVYWVGRRVYERKWYALVGGLLIAFQPWHVDFSTLGVAEGVSSFLVVLTTYSYVANKPGRFAITSFLASLSSYEAWIVVLSELILGILRKGWRGIGLVYAAISLPLAVLGWSAWSYAATGTPSTWITSTLYALYPLGWEIHLVSPSILLFYVNNLLVMTFFIFFVGFVFGLLKGGDVRAVTISMTAAVVVFSLAHYVGLDFGDQSRVVALMPLLAVVAPSAFPKFSGRKLRRTLILLMLLLVLLIPYFSQIWIFPRKVYIVMPDYRAGVALGQAYDGGRVLSDSPIAIYTSDIAVEVFMTYENARWFLASGDNTLLVEWLQSNNVRYLVWERTNYTLAHQVFPFLSDGDNHMLEGASFTVIYEDSLRTGHWEHYYNVTDVFVYRVDYW